MENPSVIHFASYFDTNWLYRELFDEMAEAGTKQAVLTPRPISKDKLADCQYPVLIKDLWTTLDRFYFGRKIRRYISYAYEQVEFSNFDLIHAHSLYSDGFAASEISKKTGLPYCVAVRSTDVNWFAKYRPHLKSRAIAVLEGAQQIIYINHQDQARFEETIQYQLDANKVRTVPNGVHIDWLNDTVENNALNSETINILSVAKVTKTKNHIALIKAVNSANNLKLDNRPPIQLTIAGSLSSRYARQLKSQYESEAVRFLGIVDRKILKNHIRSSDVFALISLRETFGISYAQALSQGVPVIFTKGQGFDGWPNQDDWGTSHDLADADSLVQHLLSLKKRQGLNRSAIRTVDDLFNWKSIAVEYREIYRQVTK